MNVLFPSALLFRLLSVWNIIQLTMSIFSVNVIFPLVPIMKSCTLCDNCVIYSTSLVYNNYLGSNKFSVENNFHFLGNVCFLIALLFRLLSVWNIIQLTMSFFSVDVIFPYVPIMKSCTLCDNCVVYSASLVSNNYLGSNKCSVGNNFHFLDNVWFPIALLFRLDNVWFLSVWNCCMKLYPVENVYLYTSRHFSPCS